MDHQTGARDSLATKDKERAQELLSAKNEAACESLFNLRKDHIYFNASDPAVRSRTWQGALNATIVTKPKGSENRYHWETAAKDNCPR